MSTGSLPTNLSLDLVLLWLQDHSNDREVVQRVGQLLSLTPRGDVGGGAVSRSPSSCMHDPLCTPIGQALEAKLEECASADAANTLLDEHAIDIDAQQPFGLETVDMALSRGLNHLTRHVQKSVPPAPRFDISFKDLKYMAKVRQGGGNDVVTVGTQVHPGMHQAARRSPLRAQRDTWHGSWWTCSAAAETGRL